MSGITLQWLLPSPILHIMSRVGCHCAFVSPLCYAVLQQPQNAPRAGLTRPRGAGGGAGGGGAGCAGGGSRSGFVPPFVGKAIEHHTGQAGGCGGGGVGGGGATAGGGGGGEEGVLSARTLEMLGGEQCVFVPGAGLVIVQHWQMTAQGHCTGLHTRQPQGLLKSVAMPAAKEAAGGGACD